MQLFFSATCKSKTIDAMERLLEDKKEGLKRLQYIREALIKQRDNITTQTHIVERNIKQTEQSEKQALQAIQKFGAIVKQLQLRQTEIKNNQFQKNFK